MARFSVELRFDDSDGWTDWDWSVTRDIPDAITLAHYDIDASRYLVCCRVVGGVSVIYRMRSRLDRRSNKEWTEGVSEVIATLWQPGQTRKITIRSFAGEERVFRFTHRSH